MKKLRGELKQEFVIFGCHRYCNVAAAIIGSAVAGGAVSAYSANKASNAQEDAAQSAQQTQLQAQQEADQTQMQMFNQTQAQQQPWIQAGQTAVGQLTAGTAAGGQFSNAGNFNAGDLNANLAPNYEFQLQQGQGALNNQNSVSGGLVGGNALQGIEAYTQGAAGNAYQQAYNNYNTNQSNVYNRLASIAGFGQTATGQNQQAGTAAGTNLANVAMTAGSNIGSAQLAAGAAQAAGYTATGNAISGGANSISSMYALNGLTGGRLFGGSAQGQTGTAGQFDPSSNSIDA